MDEENRKTASNGNPLYLLLKLVLGDWGHDSCVMRQIANAVWKQSKSDGWKLVYMFSLLADQYEVQTMKQRNISVDDFLKNHQQYIEQILMDDSIGVADIDFNKLSSAVTFAITSLVSVKMNETFIITELTKDTTIRATFGSNYNMREERRNLLGYSLNFIVWFADVLLNCDKTERKVLIEAFIDRADINRNEHVQDLLKWLIIDQEVYGKKDEFWHVWELLKSKMIELGNEEVYGYYANCNVPFGKDRVITTYLFANSAWRKNVHRGDEKACRIRKPGLPLYRKDTLRHLWEAVYTEERERKGENLCTLDMPLQKRNGDGLHEREFQRG